MLLLGERPPFGMLGCGAAAMVVTEAAFSYLFMKKRLQAAAPQAAALCLFEFFALREASAATACKFDLGGSSTARGSCIGSCVVPLLGFTLFRRHQQQQRASLTSVKCDSTR